MKRLIFVLFVGGWFLTSAYGETVSRTLPDGHKYVGEMKNGKSHGQGTHSYPDGSKYTGAWKDDRHHGQGIYTHANGDKYVGEHKDGRRHGQGTYTNANGDKYVGEFKDGRRHGQGTLTWADGSKYVGEWKDGLEWAGRKYFSDGSDEGRFVDGEFLGGSTCTIEKQFKGADGKQYVVQRCKAGRYIGEVLNSQFHGQGTYTFFNGEVYVGEWKDGAPHGQGTYTWPDGSKYVGEYKDNKQHGQGTFTYADGAFNAQIAGCFQGGCEHGLP